MAHIDEVTSWEQANGRVRDLVALLDEDGLATAVPACPDWTVHDLFAHMIGLGVDVLDGDEPDDHNAGWTGAQVSRRRERTVDELLAEWDDVRDRLPDWMRENGVRPLGDVVIHEQDLRGAVDRPGARDNDGLAAIRELMAGRLAGAVDDAGLGPMAMQSEEGDFTWASSGEVDDAPLLLRAPGFDLFRAVTSRRTADQLRGYVVRGDLDPYLDAFAGLGPLPTDPLPE